MANMIPALMDVLLNVEEALGPSFGVALRISRGNQIFELSNVTPNGEDDDVVDDDDEAVDEDDEDDDDDEGDEGDESDESDEGVGDVRVELRHLRRNAVVLADSGRHYRVLSHAERDDDEDDPRFTVIEAILVRNDGTAWKKAKPTQIWLGDIAEIVTGPPDTGGPGRRGGEPGVTH